MQKIRVLINGFCGKMGQMVFKVAANFPSIEVVEGVDTKSALENFACNFAGVTLLDDICKSKRCDVVVDFSNVSGLEKLVKFCVENKKPLVCATTGLSLGQENMLKQAGKTIPIFRAQNFSFGVQVLLKLLDLCSRLLPESDVEIVETHHKNKVDAPSGTAEMMLDTLKKSRAVKPVYDRASTFGEKGEGEVGVLSVRGGTVCGEHKISFYNLDEVLEIKHTALSKAVFAEGALKAVIFLYGKEKGIYNMKNLF